MFSRIMRKPLVASATLAGGAGMTIWINQYQKVRKEAVDQFNTSWGYSKDGREIIKAPRNWSGSLFSIKNDYPTNAALPETAAGRDEAPWLKFDFRTEPQEYCEAVKDYCYEGNVDKNFKIQDNEVRDWYHAPWMHWYEGGREPIHGLTAERPMKPGELSAKQKRYIQNWAVAFYNRAGASVFGKIWKDPNNPDWEPFRSPEGTCVFKLLFNDARDDEIVTMRGSPEVHAVIAKTTGEQERPVNSKRQESPSKLRLAQIDIAVRDDRSPTGWVFGTYMYDSERDSKDAWDRVIPVGLQWGDDPWLTPAKANAGGKPEQTWINPTANERLKTLAGKRTTWGWNGRLNGPADNFKSSCISCHSTSQRDTDVDFIPSDEMSDDKKMQWFRNIRAGEPFTPGDVSGDYSLQLRDGFKYYQEWQRSRSPLSRFLTKFTIPKFKEE